MLHLKDTVTRRHEVWNPHHWPAEWGAVRLKKKLGGPVVWMCNDVPNFHKQGRQAPRSAILKRLMYFLDYRYDRAQTAQIDAVLLLSRWAEGEFKSIYEARTSIVRSGADVERFRPGGDREKVRRRFGFSDDSFFLLWLGIIMPHRRLQDAIRAVALLKQRGSCVKLLIAGSGWTHPEYLESLRHLITELQLENEVVLGGKVAESEMRDFYCACDAFLFPNEDQTWGLAVLEAMACGVPVLVSRSAAVYEVLTDGDNALLFPARNPEALAERIAMLLTDPRKRAQIAQAGMELVRSHYNWQRFAEQMEEAFQAALNFASSQGEHASSNDQSRNAKSSV
jgi:glycosyltransferase involved in cell wall biosynthesis